MAVAVAQAIPLEHAPPSTRVDYLRKVTLLVMVGLGVSAVTGMISALLVLLIPLLQMQLVSLVVIFGSYGIANFLAPRLVFSSGATKWVGFGMGAVFQGVAMGYLLLAAVLMGAELFGNPLALVGQAMGLTALTSIGMVAYIWTGPKQLSFVKAALSMLFLPMMALMALSFVSFALPGPLAGLFGGPLGIVFSLLFVLVSAMGLLYQVNKVMHELRSDMHVEGAYLITMGILILFWNILVLLMRLNRR